MENEEKLTVERRWLSILIKINNLNRSVKESIWSAEDIRVVYDLKDKVMKEVLTKKPDCLTVNLYNVPYIKYSESTKDKAGALRRRDNNLHPFEYYLSQVTPSEYDYEIPDKATVEVEIICMGEVFSFHQPVMWIKELGIDILGIPKKVWINPKDFNHSKLVEIKNDIEELIDSM